MVVPESHSISVELMQVMQLVVAATDKEWAALEVQVVVEMEE
jgi:hypothetical protein